MWVFINDAFLSIVAHEKFTSRLLVRARLQGDIQRIFPAAKVEETPKADYRYRTLLPRWQVEAAMRAEVKRINYVNFKDSVRDNTRHNTYLRVWAVMMRAQITAHAPAIKELEGNWLDIFDDDRFLSHQANTFSKM